MESVLSHFWFPKVEPGSLEVPIFFKRDEKCILATLKIKLKELYKISKDESKNYK